MTQIPLSKIDVAKRELEFSVRLFFSRGDPVVLHLVVSAANRILRDLCKDQSVKTIMDELLSAIRPDKQKEVEQILNRAFNFFKHADNDPNGLLTFNPEATEIVTWTSIHMYQQITKEVTGIMMSYRLWFSVKHPTYFLDPVYKENMLNISDNLDLDDFRSFLELANELENMRLGNRTN